MTADELARWQRTDWMQTYTGRKFYPLKPNVEDIDPVDIAHHLSMLCRYNGAVSRFYSVAEHCVLLSTLFQDDRLARWALLHDAPEAYIGDMIRPLKVNMPSYRRVDDLLTEVIAYRFGLDGTVIPDEVKEADTRILLDEKAALLGTGPGEWYVDVLQPLGLKIEGWQPRRAEDLYLARLYDLGLVS